MTKIKLCGLMRQADIEVANELKPEYIGFVFAPKSRRYVSTIEASGLKKMLDPSIKAVGVFVDEDPLKILWLLEEGIIDMAQLHGHEDEEYIKSLSTKTDKEIIKAFVVRSEDDLKEAVGCGAHHVLLDGGLGEGESFDWSLLSDLQRPFFLAGGLDPDNVAEAVERLHPFAVDVSSGIETEGVKDPAKMQNFVNSVRSLR